MISRPRKSRGFYITAALLISVIISLFIGAALRLSVGNLKSDNQASQRALFAAESGVRYIQSRIASDYAWDADEGLVVNTPDMIVYEDNGNVVGILRTPSGDFAQFRVRFNFQDDGQGDADGRSDPALYSVDSQFVSVNNILGGSPTSVPRADGPGDSVTPASPMPYEVPSGTACVIVEGRYGPGLGSLSATDLNPTVNGRVSVRVVEAYLEAENPPGADSAAMAAGDINFDVEAGESVNLTAKDGNQISRLRSRGLIEVTGGASPNLVSTNGETHTTDGTLQADASTDVQLFTEDTSREFYSLEWSEVKKATASDSALAGGTYVVWDDGSLHYYDMSYSTYAAHIQGSPSDPGTVVAPSALPAGMSLDTSVPGKPKLTISQNVRVDGSGTTDELNIIPRKGAQENPPDAGDSATDLEATVDIVHGIILPISQASDGGYNKTEWNTTLAGSAPSPDSITVNSNGLDFELHVHSDGSLHLENNNLSAGVISADEFRATLTDPNIPPTDQAQIMTMLSAIGGAGSGSREELELGSAPSALRADDLTIEFDPPEGESAILSSEGTVRLGARVSGEGGSITSGKDIKIVGDGNTNLEASEKNGLTLYARGNVVMSGLKEVPVGSNNWEYKDVDLKGVVYAWGDIDIKLGNDDPSVSKHGNFLVQGALVAYGGDPAGAPGNNGDGAISIDAHNSVLKYDPVYLILMEQTPPARPLRQTLYNVY